MFSRFFCTYLIGNNVLDKQQFDDLLKMQKTSRLRLGTLAVEASLMTVAQADEVNFLQKQSDKRFGDIALERGYLTMEQLIGLLSKQNKEYILLKQTLTDMNYMTFEQIDEQLKNYKKHLGATDEQFEALKNNDVTGIIPIFLNFTEDKMMYNEYFSLFMKNVVRFVSEDVAIVAAGRAKQYDSQNCIYMELLGNKRSDAIISMSGNALKVIGDRFAKEDLTDELDLVDSVSEFFNCTNGLFVSKMCDAGIELDLTVPENRKSVQASCDDEFYFMEFEFEEGNIALVFNISGKKVNFKEV